MIETEKYLRDHLPGTDDKTIEVLANELVTREYLEGVKNDKSWLSNVDEEFILHQQEKIVKLESALINIKQSAETSAEKMLAGKKSSSTVQGSTGRKTSIENDIREVEIAMTNLDEQIQSETSALRLLQTRYTASQELIDDYKKTLKLPPDANHKTVLTALDGLKSENNDLKQVVSSLKCELDKSKKLQEDMKDKNTKIARLSSEVKKMKEVMRGLHIRHHPETKNKTSIQNDTQHVEAMSKLGEQVQEETSSLKMLHTKYTASQKLIDDYKKKLKLPPDADHETTLRAMDGLKSESSEQQVKSSLKIELDKSKKIQEDIKDKITKIARLSSEVQKINELMQGLHGRVLPTSKINLAYTSDALQCKSCKNAIAQAVLFCDTCNLKRLQIR